MAKIPVSITLSAIDNASKVIGALKAKLAGVSDSIQRTQIAMNASAKPFEGITRLGDAMGAKMRSAGMALTAGVTAPLAALGGVAIKTAADFEAAMNELGARTQASTADMAALQTEARRIGATTQFSASEAAQAMIVLGKAGLSTTQIMKATAATMGLASAEGLSLESASETVSDTLNQFGLDASNAGRVADVLAAAAGASTIGVADLAQTLKYAAPAGARFGASLEQLSAATAVLGNMGIKGEQAGTALRSLFNDLTANKKAIQVLQKAGVSGADIFTDSSMKTMKSLPDVLGILQKANLSDIDMAQIFGKEFAGPIGILIKNFEGVRKTSADMGNAAGFAAQLGAKRMEGFNGAVKELQSSFEELMIGSVDKQSTGLLGTATELVQKLKGLVDLFAALSPETKKTILVFAGFAAVLGPLLFILGGMASGISSIIVLSAKIGPAIAAFGGFLAALKAAFVAVTVGVWNFTAALLANPIGAVIAGVVALIAAIVLLYKNWDTVSAAVTRAWETIKSVFAENLPFVAAGISALGDALAGMWDGIVARAKSAVDALRGFVGGIIGMIPESIRTQIGLGVGASGRSMVPNVQQGPALGAANTARALVPEPARRSDSEIKVSFENMPRGVRVEQSREKGTPVDLNLGYSMMGG